MDWTYTDPASIPKDAVRLAIGDTDENAPLLFDQEIAALLAMSSNNVSATCLTAVEAIIAKLSRLCDQSVGSVSASYSQQRDGYMQLRANLKLRSAYGGGVPFAGGQSRVDNYIAERDPNRVRPLFTTRMMSVYGRGGVFAARCLFSGGPVTGNLYGLPGVDSTDELP